MSENILLQKLVLYEKTIKNLKEELKESNKLILLLEKELKSSIGKNKKLNINKKNYPKEINDLQKNLIDIGKFTNVKNDNNISRILQQTNRLSLKSFDINNFIKNKGGNIDAKFNNITRRIFNYKIRKKIINYIDDRHGNEIDFKLELSFKELLNLIGINNLNNIQDIFSDNFTKIKLRKVSSSNSYIDFHIDYSGKTLKIPLNTHREYIGGDLVYLTNGKIHIPKQNLNSLTIHNNHIVHGVTAITKGTRYSLFILSN